MQRAAARAPYTAQRRELPVILIPHLTLNTAQPTHIHDTLGNGATQRTTQKVTSSQQI